jgi:hypothetical protein
MARTCGCGEEFRSVLDEWGCLQCGGHCCPGCGYAPEGTAYCPECAQSLFGVYTRQAVVIRPKRIAAWWEAAAAQPVASRTAATRAERPQ